MLISHYREEYARNGHDPRHCYVAAGSGFLYLADTTQEAKRRFGPTYEKMVAFFNKPGNHTPGNDMTFHDIDHAIAEGPVLVGSPQQLEMIERLATEVIPVVRKAAPDTL